MPSAHRVAGHYISRVARELIRAEHEPTLEELIPPELEGKTFKVGWVTHIRSTPRSDPFETIGVMAVGTDESAMRKEMLKKLDEYWSDGNFDDRAAVQMALESVSWEDMPEASHRRYIRNQIENEGVESVGIIEDKLKDLNHEIEFRTVTTKDIAKKGPDFDIPEVKGWDHTNFLEQNPFDDLVRHKPFVWSILK